MEINDTKNIEMAIFNGIWNYSEILDEIDFDERYFTMKQMLNYFKNCYKKYNTLSTEILIDQNNELQMIEFIEKLLEHETFKHQINGLYKKLKELYRKNQIIILSNKLQKNEITSYEFNNKVNYFDKIEDFDESELLTLDNITIEQNQEREYTNIHELDCLLKGVEYGRLNLWSGITNHGKTTFMMQFAKECVLRNKKIFYFSGEQTAQEFKNYLYIGMCVKKQLDFNQDKNNKEIYDTKPKDEIIKYYDNQFKDYIYLYNNNIPENNINTMIKVMNKAHDKGVRIFFIDNFMQLDNSEKLDEQTKIVEAFKKFARDNNCIVNLVAHPRKTQFNKNRLTIFDISGTQNIANKSSNICSIIRTDLLSEAEYEELKRPLGKNGYNIDGCNAVVEVLKTKGNRCGLVGLTYDFDNKTYNQATKQEMQYVSQGGRRK